jgi:putative ATP-binding cassette transporter
MAALLVFYIVRNKAIEADLNRQRDLQNVYYKHLEDLLHGFKELKMSITRNLSIFDNFLIKNREAGRNISISTSVKYMDNELIGGYSWYIVMGITMFVLPAIFHLDIAKTSAFLITILYLIGPIAIILTLVPTYTAVKISVQRLNVFDSMLDALDSSHAVTSVNLVDEPFDSIRFEGVSYRYDKGKEQGFHLEPFDLEIQRGEIVFVTGGNGSGKSTFGYLLSGLYRPYAGKIYLNDHEINDENYVNYSDRLSAVFTTNYLFNDNYDGFELTTTNAQLLEYIELMDMGKILKLDGEQKTLGKKYSKGQQKRLALIYALLENKEVIILDEWAAEQDPRFRRYFYQEVLPLLKEKGKTVIAITHDDDYYDCATRIIKFNYGKIVNDSPVYAGKVVEN